MGSGAANLVISLVWGDGLPTGGGPENVTGQDEKGHGDGGDNRGGTENCQGEGRAAGLARQPLQIRGASSCSWVRG